MKTIYFILALITLSACHKDALTENPPNPPVDYTGDTTVLDTTINLIGEVWVITDYRIGELGPIIPISDTIQFIDNHNYTYSQMPSTYSFYVTASSYSLTLNNTPWGNLSGSMFTYNIVQGIVNGIKFHDITMGSSNGSDYYLWMHRL